MYLRVLYTCFLVGTLCLVQAEELISKEYSAKAVYYIPSIDKSESHPVKDFDKDSLKDPFEPEVFGIFFQVSILYHPTKNNSDMSKKDQSFF